MSDVASRLAAELQAYSPLEGIAVACAIAYLLLAIRENIWCWLFAGLSTAMYVYLFVAAKLYMESLLNVFYFGMAIYGWYAWYFGRGGEAGLAVSRWPLSRHMAAVAAIVVVGVINGHVLARFTDAAYPYVDSLTTWGAIWTTFLVARKVLENWWYWLVIDTVSVFIYWSRDLPLTALLFVVYIVLIPFGLIAWHRSWREARA